MWTKQTLSEMTIPEGKRKLVITDPDTRGLIFEVREQSRSFYLRYSFEGKQRTVALGPFPTLSLADARRKAEDLKRKVYMGENPLEAKQTKREIPTFNEFFRDVYQPFSVNRLANLTPFRRPRLTPPMRCVDQGLSRRS